MDSTDNRSSNSLTDDQIERLSTVVLDQFGPSLTQGQFNEAVLTLLEDVAGFEAFPRWEVSRLLARVWRVYWKVR